MTDTIIIPAVGMPAAFAIGSDVYPVTVIEISKSGRRIVVQSASATPAEGYSYESNQVHTFTPNPNGSKEVWSLRKDGKWRPKGCQANSGYRLYLGEYRSYSNPSF